MKRYSEEDKILKGYKFIDLFCGIGGFHLALSSLGANCVFASDINNRACDVYENNFKIYRRLFQADHFKNNTTIK